MTDSVSRSDQGREGGGLPPLPHSLSPQVAGAQNTLSSNAQNTQSSNHQPVPPLRKYKPSQGNVPKNYYGDISALKNIVGDEIAELEKWTRSGVDASGPAGDGDGNCNGDGLSETAKPGNAIKFPETYDELIEIEIPDTNIGEGVDISGELQFKRLLRVDGAFRGSLSSSGNIVVGKGGSISGDIMQIDTVVVNGGRIEGNIVVESLVVKNGGIIIGNISSKTLKVVGSDCYIKGKINVHSLSPEVIDESGDILFRIDGAARNGAYDTSYRGDMSGHEDDEDDEDEEDDDVSSLERYDVGETRLLSLNRASNNEIEIDSEDSARDPRKEKERIIAEKRVKKLALSKQVEDSFRSLHSSSSSNNNKNDSQAF